MTSRKLDTERAPFAWDDPLGFEDDLSEDERILMVSARKFAAGKLMTRVVDDFRNESADRSILTEMGAMGFLGATIPESYGGAGLSAVGYGLIAREIERVDSGYRSAMSVQSSLVMYPIYAFGSDEQRRTYLPRLATGELVGAFGLTEPDAGSDPAGMTTRAKSGARRLHGERLQDLDLERAICRPDDRLGEDGRGHHPRLHSRARHEGPHDAQD